MGRNTFIMLIISFTFFANSLQANIPAPVEIGKSIQPQEILNHIRYLASKKLEGRRTATKGERLAGEYIKEEFQKYGLLPGGEKNSYFQSFPIISGREAEAKLAFGEGKKRKIHLVRGKDYYLYTYSNSGNLSSSVVFAGYGLQTKTYNHFLKGKVKGRIVCLLDGLPNSFAKKIPPRYRQYYGSPAFKASIARKLGAAGVIVLVDTLKSAHPFHSVGGKRDVGIPVIYLSMQTLKKKLPQWAELLKKWIVQAKKASQFQPKPFPRWKISGKIKIHYIRGYGRNVIAYLPGNDPRLSKEIIVLGAHYDHLGHGGHGSLARGSHKIHFGADDNASGTAVLLELAEAFSILQGLNSRTLVFIAFSGEELGLLGSQYFVKHPTFSLKHIVAMINMDMVGRLRENKLQIFGSGTSSVWPAVIGRGESLVRGFRINLSSKGGFGPSDHTSFYKKKIPVLHFFTGLHKDYHKPSDTLDKINAKGAAKIGQLVFQIVWALDELPYRPDYIYIKPPRRVRHGKGPRPYLGIIPEYGGDNQGLVISGVSANSPAEKGGLKGEDRIIQFGSVPIRNIYDLTNALYRYKPGDKVKIIVVRKGKKRTLTVKLGHR